MEGNQMKMWFAAIVLTCYLIGGLEASGCQGVDHTSLEPVKAPCLSNRTCTIVQPGGKTSHCDVLYGKDCRYMGQGQRDSHHGVTSSSQSSLAILSRLRIVPVVIGDIPIYNFHVDIGVPIKDINNELITGIKMEFQSTGDDNDNCQYRTIPVCRYFHVKRTAIGQNIKDRTVDKSTEFSPRSDQRPTQYGNMASISRSCFGLDVLPGSFLIRLTSFPESSESLEYLVKWSESYYDDYDYYNQKNILWPYQVVGVAKDPRANHIHVVVQGPDTHLDNSILCLELRHAKEERKLGQRIWMRASESRAIFRQVPMGLYNVKVTLKEHPCEFDGNCPSFVSDDVYVDTPLEEPVSLDEDDVVMSTKMVITLVIVCLVCVLCVITTVVLWNWPRSSKVNKRPSVLLVNMEKGRLKEKTVTYLADVINDILGIHDCTIQVNNCIGNGKQGDYLIKSENIDFLTKSKTDLINLKLVRRKIKPYRIMVLVRFLSERVNGSEFTQIVKDEYSDVMDILMMSLQRHKCRHTKTCVVYFTDPSQKLSDILSSIGSSTSSESTVDSFSTVTCLIPIGDGGEGHVENKKTASTSNIRSLKFEENNNNNNDNTYGSSKDNKDKSLTQPSQTFYLPSEAVKFLEWINSYSNTSSPDSTPLLFSKKINQCEKYQAMLTCSGKVFAERKKSNDPALCYHSNEDACLTIITEDASPRSSQMDILEGSTFITELSLNEQKIDKLCKTTQSEDTMSCAECSLLDGSDDEDDDCRSIITESFSNFSDHNWSSSPESVDDISISMDR